MPATLERRESDQLIRPSVRVLPVPRLEPPSDDELSAAGIEAPPGNAPPLPLELPGGPRVRRGPRLTSGRPAWAAVPANVPSAEPAPTAVVDARRAGAPPGGSTAALGLRPADPRPAGPSAAHGAERGAGLPDARSAGLPDARGAVTGTRSAGPRGTDDPPPPSPCRGAVMRFLNVVFEVAGGFRPIAQLRGLCLPERFDDISVQITGRHPTIAGRRSRTGGFVPPHAQIGARIPAARQPIAAPPRTARIDPRGPGKRIAVRRLQICDVNDEVAEVSVVLSRGSLIWAVAARMELVNNRWLCAHLEII